MDFATVKRVYLDIVDDGSAWSVADVSLLSFPDLIQRRLEVFVRFGILCGFHELENPADQGFPVSAKAIQSSACI